MIMATSLPGTTAGRTMPVSVHGSRRENPAHRSVWTSGQELGVISMTIRYKTYVFCKIFSFCLFFYAISYQFIYQCFFF